MARIAINGFGRIGRLFFRQGFGLPGFDIVAINDLGDAKTLAYLLTYDSVYRTYEKKVEEKNGNLVVDGKEIIITQKKEPKELPWKELNIDIVIESSGFFTSSESAKAHLDAGARRVIITAPATGDVVTALVGVNEDRFQAKPSITCNASCTTNSVAPVVSILHSAFGIQKASMATVHSYTATQKIVDGPDAKDMRRGRAAAVNIVPSTTGAAEAVIQAVPELKGKFSAVAMRIPSITGSLSIITALLEKRALPEEINKTFETAARSSQWSETLTVTRDQIVSSDIIGSPYGAIIDLLLTQVTDGNLATVFSWYDNEFGYTATLIKHVERVIKNL